MQCHQRSRQLGAKPARFFSRSAPSPTTSGSEKFSGNNGSIKSSLVMAPTSIPVGRQFLVKRKSSQNVQARPPQKKKKSRLQCKNEADISPISFYFPNLDFH